MFSRASDRPDMPAMKRGDYQKSLPKLLKKAESASRKGDRVKTAWFYQQASLLARKARQWEDSAKYALLAAEYSERAGNRFNAGWAYRSAAIAARGRGDLSGAVKYALSGAECFLQTKSTYAAWWCYHFAGQSSRESGDLNSAIKYYERAHRVEPDDDTWLEIEELKHLISHPKVDQYAESREVVEYQPVKFDVVVENHGKEVLRDIVICDKESKLSREISSLGPGEVKVFTHEARGGVGWVRSPFEHITWKNSKGECFSMELEPARALVRPRVQVNSYVSPDAVIGRESELIVMVKNLSSSPLFDVKIDTDFSENVRVGKSSPVVFKKISPGEELGTEWEIKPLVLGRQHVASGKVSMKDEAGNAYLQRVPEIMAEVLERPGPPSAAFEKREEFDMQKKEMDSSIKAYPVTEKQYMEMHGRYYHQQRGYTFRGISIDVVAKHVRGNCRDMAPVSKFELEREKMMLYSFRINDVHYLLTVVIKKDEGFVHLILKLHSPSSEMLVPVLGRLSDIIRYTITAETEAREVERIQIKKVVNIIDSVVQRSKIGPAEEEGEVTSKKTRIKDSVVQRTEV